MGNNQQVFTGYFPNARLNSLAQAAAQAGLADPGRRGVLLNSIDPGVAAMMPAIAAPFNQLLSDLQVLNRTQRLLTDEIPLKNWLETAVVLTGALPQSRTLQQALDEVVGNVPAQPELPDPRQLPEINEQIIHEDDMVPYGFLIDGMEAGVSVAKLFVTSHRDGVPRKLPGGRLEIHNGTGWLITDNLLVTNYHVVNARSPGQRAAPLTDLHLQAQSLQAQFDFNAEGAAGVTIDASKLEAWNAELDYAIVRLAQPPERQALRLAPEPLENPRGQSVSVNIIQHPGGLFKKVAMRNNVVSYTDAKEMRYFTDTDRGSSGSPVFDDLWQVVALYRGARPASNVNFQGRTEAVINFGTQIHAILEDLQQSYPEIWQEIQAASMP